MRGCIICLFFLKQKTAYEVRISDWSSDVCSSDLKLKNQYGMKGGWTVPTVMGLNQTLVALRAVEAAAKKSGAANVTGRGVREALLSTTITSEQTFASLPDVNYTNDAQIGRASCREGVCQYV